MADNDLITTWTDRLRHEIPDAVAVLLKGSHVWGDDGPHSDIDFDVLVDGPETERYPLWIEPDASGRLRHVSAGVRDLASWIADGNEPEPWALGLPVREPTRLLWAATPALRKRRDRWWGGHPPAAPAIEDWFECLGKMRNAARRDDDLGLRLAAQGIGRYTPTLLRPLNPAAFATGPRSAIDLVLAFPVAPEGYRDDLLACLGLTDGVAADALMRAADRLVTGTLALLSEHLDVVAPLIAGDIAAILRDGTLTRYITAMTEESP